METERMSPSGNGSRLHLVYGGGMEQHLLRPAVAASSEVHAARFRPGVYERDPRHHADVAMVLGGVLHRPTISCQPAVSSEPVRSHDHAKDVWDLGGGGITKYPRVIAL